MARRNLQWFIVLWKKNPEDRFPIEADVYAYSPMGAVRKFKKLFPKDLVVGVFPQAQKQGMLSN